MKKSKGRDCGGYISSLVRSGKDVIVGSPKYKEVVKTSTLHSIDLSKVVVEVYKPSVK